MQCRNSFKYAAMLHVHNTMLAATIALIVIVLSIFDSTCTN